MRRLQIIAVTFAILAMARLLHAATPEEIAVQIAIERAKEREAEKPAATFVIPPTILPRDETPVAPIVPFSEAELPAGQKPTPMESVRAMVAGMQMKAGKTLVVWGSGPDARIEREAAKQCPGLTIVGLEIDPEVAESARGYVERDGLRNQIQIITADATKLNIPADYAAAYLFEDTLAELRPQIQRVEKFVSYMHPVPGMGGIRSAGDIYFYKRPAPQPQVQSQVQLVQPSFGYWNGNRARPKSGCNCAMCQSLRQQMQPRYVTTTAPQVQAAPARSGHWETRVVGKRCVNGVCTPITKQFWVPN